MVEDVLCPHDLPVEVNIQSDPKMGVGSLERDRKCWTYLEMISLIFSL